MLYVLGLLCGVDNYDVWLTVLFLPKERSSCLVGSVIFPLFMPTDPLEVSMDALVQPAGGAGGPGGAEVAGAGRGMQGKLLGALGKVPGFRG